MHAQISAPSLSHAGSGKTALAVFRKYSERAKFADSFILLRDVLKYLRISRREVVVASNPRVQSALSDSEERKLVAPALPCGSGTLAAACPAGAGFPETIIMMQDAMAAQKLGEDSLLHVPMAARGKSGVLAINTPFYEVGSQVQDHVQFTSFRIVDETELGLFELSGNPVGEGKRESDFFSGAARSIAPQLSDSPVFGVVVASASSPERIAHPYTRLGVVVEGKVEYIKEMINYLDRILGK